MLATVNRSRVSIRVTKVFGQGVVVLGVVDPVNFNLSSSLIAMQKSVDVSRIVCKHVKVRKIWGRWTLGGGWCVANYRKTRDKNRRLR